MDQSRVSHLLQRSLLGIVLGIIYAQAAFEDSAELLPVSAITGLVMGLLTAWLDHYIFSGKIRRLRFLTVLAVRTITYLVVIVLTILSAAAIVQIMRNPGLGIGDLVKNPKLYAWLFEKSFSWGVFYSFMILLLVQYINVTIRLIGPQTLRNYIIGRYHQPKEEERIFMFLDIKNSTGMAEALGHFRWHKMLNDFFFDITRPVYDSKGSIYQYVGDEVVVTWIKERGVSNVNCIRCFYRIKKRIASRQERYLKKYGFNVEFKAGLHIGKVVTGEIGDYKRDIVFHGDAINTASRIQEECNRLKKEILLSSELLELLPLTEEFVPEYLEDIKLRGKEKPIRLNSIKVINGDGT